MSPIKNNLHLRDKIVLNKATKWGEKTKHWVKQKKKSASKARQAVFAHRYFFHFFLYHRAWS